MKEIAIKLNKTFCYLITSMTYKNLSKYLAHDCLIKDLLMSNRNLIILSENSQVAHTYSYRQTNTIQIWCSCEHKIDKELGHAVQNDVLDFVPNMQTPLLDI